MSYVESLNFDTVPWGYNLFVKRRRLKVIKATVGAAAKLASVRQKDIRGHETFEFWRYESTLPQIATYLQVPLAGLRELFFRHRRTEGSWLYHNLCKDNGGKPDWDRVIFSLDASGAYCLD